MFFYDGLNITCFLSLNNQENEKKSEVFTDSFVRLDGKGGGDKKYLVLKLRNKRKLQKKISIVETVCFQETIGIFLHACILDCMERTMYISALCINVENGYSLFIFNW